MGVQSPPLPAAKPGMPRQQELGQREALLLPQRRQSVRPRFAPEPSLATGRAGRAHALVAACLRTLAPTSPSAHSAPPAVWTSTRQTTIAVEEPPTGARVWVRVQRA